ncbi:MAG: hypothetical protein WDZ84_05010 [Rhodovibrionaceae bacterium]
MPDSITDQDVRAWLSRRPGLFERDTENRCWRAAFDHFADGRGLSEIEYFEFMSACENAGFDVRATALGGYVLDAST